MRILPLRTISGRIVLGFFVLMATFGGLSGYTLFSMHELSHEMRFILSAYLEISVDVAKLQQLEDGLVDHLEGAVPERPRVKWNREQQTKLIDAIDHKLGSLGDVPPGHRAAISRMKEYVESLRRFYDENGFLYDGVFAQTTDISKVQKAEERVQKYLRRWFQTLRGRAEFTTLKLERAEEQARVVAIGLGIGAIIVGLLVTLWAVLTLRPLGRLRDGVRKVGRGDYRQRLDVEGGTEVAEVAREFNAMAAAIEERQQKLVRSERLAAVGKMAAAIAHEIRNPMSSIGLNAELLEEEFSRLPNGASSEAVGLARSIQKEVDRLSGITEEYLRFARLPRPKPERESLGGIVSGLLQFQKEELQKKGIRIVVELTSDLPAVLADEGQLRQALLNLIRNAADAMSGGGTLTVATKKLEGGAQVRVADTGPGIPSDVLPHIFEPFFSTKEGGTGLGLALTRQIVEEHGGRIDVESKAGQGTKFLVWLPGERAG